VGLAPHEYSAFWPKDEGFHPTGKEPETNVDIVLPPPAWMGQNPSGLIRLLAREGYRGGLHSGTQPITYSFLVERIAKNYRGGDLPVSEIRLPIVW
jgi:hypothetical protein